MSHVMTLSQERQVRVASGFDAAAGLWLIVAPFILDYAANGGSVANDIVVGALVLLLAGGQAISNVSESRWPSWATVLLGGWLIASPFMFSFASGSNAMWNDIILGIVVAALGLVGVFTIPAEVEE